jgi:hypothetical protein
MLAAASHGIAMRDLLKSIISKQKFVIDELEHYIRG